MQRYFSVSLSKISEYELEIVLKVVLEEKSWRHQGSAVKFNSLQGRQTIRIKQSWKTEFLIYYMFINVRPM